MFAFRMLMTFFCLSTLLISCGDGGGAGTNGDVGSISEFRVSSSRVHVGQEVTLSARAKSLDDKGVPDVEISFSVEINQSGSTSGTMKATTDGSGYASVTWKAGFQTGTDTIVARGPGDAKATLQV
ncbi:MAG: hypothetical protein EOM25_12150, partial [Deltaproteobacteria bacterium]|nr:hypothetical protein [Deltaproteobacteria bacterium]